MFSCNRLSNNDKKLIKALLGDLRTEVGPLFGETNFIEVRQEGCNRDVAGTNLLVSSFEELFERAENQPYEENISIRPTPCYYDSRGITVMVQRCIWSNLRYGDDLHYAYLEGRLSDLPCPPSAIVDTGDALDAYWLLSKGLTTVEEVNVAEWTAGWLSTSLLGMVSRDGSSDNVFLHNKAHVKVPGTINYHVFGSPKVALKHSDLKLRYPLRELSLMAWGLAQEHWPWSDEDLKIPQRYRTIPTRD